MSEDDAPKHEHEHAQAQAQAAEDTSAPETRVESAEDAPDAIFDTLWARVEASWDDDKPHHAFLDYAIRSQRLPDAAGRYRAVKDAAKDADPAKAARAQKKLDGIVIAATHMLMAMKTPPARYKVPPPITLTVFAIITILLGWLFYAMRARR